MTPNIVRCIQRSVLQASHLAFSVVSPNNAPLSHKFSKSCRRTLTSVVILFKDLQSNQLIGG